VLNLDKLSEFITKPGAYNFVVSPELRSIARKILSAYKITKILLHRNRKLMALLSELNRDFLFETLP